MKILIAEDQAPSALFLKRSLERMGHQAVIASDGREAFEMLEKTPFSVVISDWVMPRMDGSELCRAIRKRENRGYVFIILLTSKDGRQDRLDGLRAGADDFLTKPPDSDELTVRLEIAERILAVHHALEVQNERLAELATIDELTGVKNRRRFREDLEIFHSVSIRRQLPLSVLMLDVDHFKSYNDQFGHPAGDQALRKVAAFLTDNTRAHDVVARYGGEEFVVLLPSTGAIDATILADRLRGQIESFDWLLREVTVSIGVATTNREGSTPEMLVESADQALYHAKRSGRNRVVHCDSISEALNLEASAVL